MDLTEDEVLDQQVEQICELLNRQLGFSYGPQKKYLIFARLDKRLKELNLTSYQDYLALLEHNQAELNRFYALLTTNVTYFFREAKQFQALEQDILPLITKSHQVDHKIRCWSAGCSSGEEPYTLAIILQEILAAAWDIKILATDISELKLEEGMAGIYDYERIQGVPTGLRNKYFMPVTDLANHFQVKPELRNAVLFRKTNLIEDFDFPSHIIFDMIFCRNVFIYLAKESREKAVNGFYNCLHEKGYLFLGLSESIDTYADPRWYPNKGAIYRKK